VQVNVLDADRPVAKRFFEWCAEMIPGAAEGSLEYENFRVSHGSFFQVNRFLIGKLVEEAIGDAAGETALDLYAGVGLFSLSLARRFRRVTAVESTNSATTDLAFNAERAGVRVDIAKQPVEYFLAAAKEPTDFVLADPPRAGLGKRAIEQLVRLKPRNITLVACDPATLARDLGPLTAAGYGINKMTIVDLFPQTYHLECVVHLGLI
jgi:23S rRNA (uracil1939-C5)-methyltransferase